MNQSAAMIVAVGLLAACATAAEPAKLPLAGARVLMVIAQKDFQDDELAKPKAVLEQAGAAVTVASTKTGECRGMNGARVTAELALGDVKAEDYAVVIFVGGSGSEALLANPAAHALARRAVAANRVVGAICLAPAILAKAGVLKGKSATVWDDEFHTYSKILKDGGASHLPRAVVTDGRIVTANGPQAAQAFGEAILAVLVPPKR